MLWRRRRRRRRASRFSELLFWSRNPYSLLCGAGLQLCTIVYNGLFYFLCMTRIPKYNSLLFCFVKEAGKSTVYKKIVWKSWWALGGFLFLRCGFAFFCSISLENLLLPPSPPLLLNWDSKHVEYKRRNLHLSPVTKWCQNCRGYITFFAFEDKGTRRLRTFASECQTHWKCIESCEFPRVEGTLGRPLTHFSSSSSSSTLRDSLGMFLSGWNLSEGVSKQWWWMKLLK